MKFSLVIPVAPWRNAEIIGSIKTLDYDKKKFEIIIEKGTNASENRNKGIKKSKGDWIVFLDDDALIDKSFLKNAEEFIKSNPDVSIFGGPQLNPEKEGLFEKISGIALTSNFGAFKVNKRYKKGEESFNVDETYLTSANLCVKKEVFNKIGNFNTSLYPGEDPEFISRAKKSGLKIAYSPKIVIFHKRRDNLKSFCKQIFNYGVVRPKRNKILQETKFFFLIPMFFVIYLLFLPLLILLNKLFIIPLLVYITLSIIFSLYDSITNKNLISFFILPLIYLIIHITYGFGMLIGYLKSFMKNG